MIAPDLHVRRRNVQKVDLEIRLTPHKIAVVVDWLRRRRTRNPEAAGSRPGLGSNLPVFSLPWQNSIEIPQRQVWINRLSSNETLTPLAFPRKSNTFLTRRKLWKMSRTSAGPPPHLVLLVLRHQVVHVGLGLSELHLIHALARVPVQERLATEHSCTRNTDSIEWCVQKMTRR